MKFFPLFVLMDCTFTCLLYFVAMCFHFCIYVSMYLWSNVSHFLFWCFLFTISHLVEFRQVSDATVLKNAVLQNEGYRWQVVLLDELFHWLGDCKSSRTVWCRYKAVKFSQILAIVSPHLTQESKIWDVFMSLTSDLFVLLRPLQCWMRLHYIRLDCPITAPHWIIFS